MFSYDCLQDSKLIDYYVMKTGASRNDISPTCKLSQKEIDKQDPYSVLTKN